MVVSTPETRVETDVETTSVTADAAPFQRQRRERSHRTFAQAQPPRRSPLRDPSPVPPPKAPNLGG